MDYVKLLEMAVRRRPFRLHPGLDPARYQITDSLRDHERWRVYSYQDSGWSEESGIPNTKAGTLTEMGYVMISLDDDTIIPISRVDEHHRGYDVLSDEIAKHCRKNGHPIDSRRFVPVWSYGTNYIYSKADIPIYLNVLEKFLAYGGKDGPLQGAGSDETRTMLMNSSDFIASRGEINVATGELAPAGKRVYDMLQGLASTIRAADEGQPSSVGRAFQAATKAAAALRVFIPYFCIDSDAYGILHRPEIIANMKKARDLRGLEEAFFGFGGLKNSIHNAIREFNVRQKNGKIDYWSDDKIKSMWGDPSLAEDMLGRI